MDDFLRALAGSSGRDHDESESLTDVQIVARLRECVSAMAEPHKFTTGQIVLHKWPSLADTKGAERPGVFLRYLEKPVRGWEAQLEVGELGSNSAAMTLDCIIARISHGSFAGYLADSSQYRPHPDFPTQ